MNRLYSPEVAKGLLVVWVYLVGAMGVVHAMQHEGISSYLGWIGFLVALIGVFIISKNTQQIYSSGGPIRRIIFAGITVIICSLLLIFSMAGV